MIRLDIGDSRELLAALEPCSIDAILTDGPYELGFMGRAWDSTGIVYDPEFWRLCLRALKPGGHLANFCATRTYHRMACAVEDCGFEIRDMLEWMYGSGFPKSLDLAKAIDKSLGAEREIIGTKLGRPGYADTENTGGMLPGMKGAKPGYLDVTEPATPEAAAWDGWGTALKPAHEPIVLARKPVIGTVIGTVLEFGTGGLHVDACRVGDDERRNAAAANKPGGPSLNMSARGMPDAPASDVIGRWPPNAVLSPETAAKLGDRASYFPVFDYGEQDRFFYAAKASRDEREAGCEHLPARTGAEAVERAEGSAGKANPRAGAGRTANEVRNFHPTVKPVSLMRWLCRLICPPGGTILDPFAGSGTTGIAAVSEGFDFVGFELDPDHHAIAMARIEHAAAVSPQTNRADYTPPPKKQLGLFS